MLYREITAVCSELHTKHINKLCGQNVWFVNVKPGGTWSNHWDLNGKSQVTPIKLLATFTCLLVEVWNFLTVRWQPSSRTWTSRGVPSSGTFFPRLPHLNQLWSTTSPVTNNQYMCNIKHSTHEENNDRRLLPGA